MPGKEGEILKNKLKGTGLKMEEIAGLLGMTRQNLSYHLRKDKLEEDFRRLLNEKGKLIFQPDNITPLYSMEELKRKIEEQWQVIRSQQETILIIAKKEAPDISKNG